MSFRTESDEARNLGDVSCKNLGVRFLLFIEMTRTAD